MRFCMITTFYPPYSFGGDGTYVKALSRALTRRGHDVTVIHCEDAYRLKSSSETIHPSDSGSVKVHGLRHSGGLVTLLINQQLGVPGLRRRGLQKILDQPFDVVNFHNISLVGGPGVISMSQAPVNLFTAHEHWLLCPTHIFWKNGKEACEHRQCIRCCIRSRIPPQLWRYTPLLPRNLDKIDCIISPSEYTAKKHRELLERPGRIEVIPLCSCLSPKDFSYLGSGRSEFLYVGRVTASKGVARLLASFAKWPDFGLTVIGDGELLPSLKRDYASYGNIRFLGSIPQRDLVEHYREATALILPSLAPETFGLTVIEAFACGTPAIVRSAGGNRETIERSAAGFLYSNEQELLASLNAFESNPSLRGKLGAIARMAYEEHYSEDIHIERYLSLVDSIMEGKSEFAGNSA